jgi:probable rRNA maturation factor
MPSPDLSKITFHSLVSSLPLRNRKHLKGFLLDELRRRRKKVDQLAFIFCDDEYLLSINKLYLKHDYYTDIITFDLSDNVGMKGEIYISLDRVRDNASNFGATPQNELHRVMFHGLLHLCGLKDKTKADQRKMRKAEDDLLSRYFN